MAVAAQAHVPKLNTVRRLELQRAAQLRGGGDRLVRDFLGNDRACRGHVMRGAPAIQHLGRGCGYLNLVPQCADLGDGSHGSSWARGRDVGTCDQRRGQSSGDEDVQVDEPKHPRPMPPGLRPLQAEDISVAAHRLSGAQLATGQVHVIRRASGDRAAIFVSIGLAALHGTSRDKIFEILRGSIGIARRALASPAAMFGELWRVDP